MSKDILDQMTKQEPVFWIRRRVIQRPKKSDVLYIRWEILAQKQKQLREASTAAFQELDLDAMRILKDEFNECSDTVHKDALWKQILTHRKKAEEYLSICEEFNALILKSDRLFEQYKAALDLESHQ